MAKSKKSTERVRLIIDTEEDLRRAVQIRAAANGTSPSDILNELIRENFKAEISHARRFLRAEDESTAAD